MLSLVQLTKMKIRPTAHMLYLPTLYDLSTGSIFSLVNSQNRLPSKPDSHSRLHCFPHLVDFFLETLFCVYHLLWLLNFVFILILLQWVFFGSVSCATAQYFLKGPNTEPSKDCSVLWSPRINEKSGYLILAKHGVPCTVLHVW